MSNIRVTKEQIANLMKGAEINVETVFGKCTTVAMKLQNGFVLTESSACVDPANYDPELGKQLCLEHIENKLWELEGYALQKQEHEKRMKVRSGSDFGWALDKMRYGFPVRRKGWNGKGIFVKMQVPDENSKMTSPYIYIDTTGLQSDNAFAPRSCVPWLASQTDMLATDWEIAD